MIKKQNLHTHSTYCDGMAYARKYYDELSKLPQYGNFDIIGHFDLLTKHIDTNDFFDYNSAEYLSYAFAVAEKLAGKISYFEVNTGAIARGYRKTPYPAIPIIKKLKELGFGAVITFDCHNREMLDCYFPEAEWLLCDCGFKYKYVLTEDSFEPIKI